MSQAPSDRVAFLATYEDAAQLVQHPVLGCIEALEMLLGPADAHRVRFERRRWRRWRSSKDVQVTSSGLPHRAPPGPTPEYSHGKTGPEEEKAPPSWKRGGSNPATKGRGERGRRPETRTTIRFTRLVRLAEGGNESGDREASPGDRDEDGEPRRLPRTDPPLATKRELIHQVDGFPFDIQRCVAFAPGAMRGGRYLARRTNNPVGNGTPKRIVELFSRPEVLPSRTNGLE